VYTGGGRIILSDGGGIRRNVIVVQKPSLASAVTTATAVKPVSSVTPVSIVSPVTVDIPGSNSSTLLPPEASGAVEQVGHVCDHAIMVKTAV